MRGLKKTALGGANTHIHGHGDSMTNSARCGELVKIGLIKLANRLINTFSLK
jgi:hypothetical protein